MARKQAPKQTPALPADTGLTYTLREAADLTGVSRGTVRRYLDEGGRPGRFPHAFQDDDGVWRIPVADLTGAGLVIGGKPEPTTTASEVERLRAEVVELRLEAVAATREAEVLRGEVEHLRMLTGFQAQTITNLSLSLPSKASPWRPWKRRGAEAQEPGSPQA